jgi:hypothetical protein
VSVTVAVKVTFVVVPSVRVTSEPEFRATADTVGVVLFTVNVVFAPWFVPVAGKL